MGLRNVRVSDALWSAALKRAASEGTTVSAVLNDALRVYTGLEAPGGLTERQRAAGAAQTAVAVRTRRSVGTAPGSVGTAERTAAAEGKPLDRLGEPCPHPKARVLRGLCMACGEAVTPAKAV